MRWLFTAALLTSACYRQEFRQAPRPTCQSVACQQWRSGLVLDDVMFMAIEYRNQERSFPPPSYFEPFGFRDAWGNPIHIVEVDGHFAVITYGADGRWGGSAAEHE